MIKISLCLLITPTLCFALQEDPWFENCFQFHFLPQYNYNFFRKVDHAKPQIKRTFNTHVLNAGLDFTAPETWNFEGEIEFAGTTTVSWGYRSFALQVRKLWLDDVCGDPFSLTTGIVYRDASLRMRRALSTPYHARANFELHSAFGKEWPCGCYWLFRTFGCLAIGQGNKGSPWLRSDLFFMCNVEDLHEFHLYALGYFGFGSKETVHTKPFHGWSHIKHRSIDLGITYRFWETLQFDYLYRVFARSYPEKVNTFILTVDIPFSVF